MFDYKFPILNARIADGSIYIIDGALIGIASDGMELSIGVTADPEAAERYLSDFPTPDVW